MQKGHHLIGIINYLLQLIYVFFLSLQYPTKPSLVRSTRAVLPLATVGAVLRETARLPQAATVMSPATTSAPAVMTLQQVAATVRTQ